MASKFPSSTRIELTSHFTRAPPTMSREKRPANDAFGSSQLVKRARPDATDSTALTVANGTAQNGALIQTVHHTAHSLLPLSIGTTSMALTGAIGTAN
jgi:hypothetical protein